MRRSNVSFGALLWATFKLWTPALVFVAIGVYLSHTLTLASEQSVYASGLADEYCELRNEAGVAVVPCTGLARPITEPVLRPLSDARNVEEDAALLVSGARKQVLAASEALAASAVRAGDEKPVAGKPAAAAAGGADGRFVARRQGTRLRLRRRRAARRTRRPQAGRAGPARCG